MITNTILLLFLLKVKGFTRVCDGGHIGDFGVNWTGFNLNSLSLSSRFRGRGNEQGSLIAFIKVEGVYQLAGKCFRV